MRHDDEPRRTWQDLSAGTRRGIAGLAVALSLGLLGAVAVLGAGAEAEDTDTLDLQLPPLASSSAAPGDPGPSGSPASITATSSPAATVGPGATASPTPAGTTAPPPAVPRQPARPATTTPSASSSPTQDAVPCGDCPDGKPGWYGDYYTGCAPWRSEDVEPGPRQLDLASGLRLELVLPASTAAGPSVQGSVIVSNTGSGLLTVTKRVDDGFGLRVLGGWWAIAIVDDVQYPARYTLDDKLLPGQAVSYPVSGSTTTCGDTSRDKEPGNVGLKRYAAPVTYVVQACPLLPDASTPAPSASAVPPSTANPEDATALVGCSDIEVDDWLNAEVTVL